MHMMDPVKELREVASEFRLELASPEAVVDVAWRLVDALSGNEPLVELTGAESTRADVGPLLRKALEWEGFNWPSEEEAGKWVALKISGAIVEGILDPVEGARTIWWNIIETVPTLRSQFMDFVALASEWEDDVAHRREYEAGIREVATATIRMLSEERTS